MFLQALLYAPRLAPLRAAAFLALLLIVSWLALSPRPPQGASLGWDKANHACAFAALTLTACLAWPRRPWWFIAAALLAYGGAIEIAQSQLPPREADWLDLLGDGAGIGLGLLTQQALQRLIRRRAGT